MNQNINYQWVMTRRRPLDLASSSLGEDEWNLIDAVCDNPAMVEPTPASQPLSEKEIEVLRDGGVCIPESEDQGALLSESEGRLFVACREVVETSLTETDVAALLGLVPAQVRGLAQQKPPQLHMFEFDNTPLYPGWQFDSEGAIPHLGELLLVLQGAGGLSPFALHRLMILPTEDLETEVDGPISPREFLVQRYDPVPLLNMVRSVHLGM